MKNLLKCMLLMILLAGVQVYSYGQRVGLVLSGGGASGLAHIGVIKALEENNVPIDYITGTSMGAMVGGMYAAGYTVEEMIEMVNSPAFILSVVGELPDTDLYYFTKDEEDASIIRLKLSPTQLLQKSIPTNLVTPDLMEYMLMEFFAQASAASNYDFDSLMVPFRCVAADIAQKKQVIFSSGSLPKALRASSTYPFYYKPLMVDSALLFDGGLYNNFPADIMYDHFLPDVIIGSNVAALMDPPDEDDIVSQIRNMIISQSDFSLRCENGIIIEPPSQRGVFDFSDVNSEIQLGYEAAIKDMDEILSFISKERNEEARDSLRKSFRSDFYSKKIGDVQVLGDISKQQKEYVRSTIGPNKGDSVFTFEDFRPQFLRIAQDDKIRYAQPVSRYNPATGLFDIDINVRRERDLTAYFGGNFSSRPINIGYVGLKYNIFGRTSASLMANSYFGKFYGSGSLRAKIDYGGKKRISIEPHLVLNRWDYFRSYATFFEPSRPSFIVKNEVYGGLGVASPWGNNTVFRADIRYGETLDRYYQTENFSIQDTADFTTFAMGTFGIGLDRNTLNHKTYATRGTRVQISGRAVLGNETTEYGTTLPELDSTITDTHSWIELKARYENYFLHFGPLTIGAEIEGLFSTKPFFDNYTASLISAPAYQPIPESKTIFLEEFRAVQYAAVGLKTVFDIRKNLDFRLEGYAFQPGKSILRNENNEAVFSEPFLERRYIAAGALVFQSPLGPVSLNLNYYDNNPDRPWSFFFNFGFTIFNKSIYEL